MHPILTIDTQDGASIRIEGRGYAHRANRADQLWRVAATLLFSANEESYAWLDGTLGVWEGEFDAARHIAHYRGFVQTPAQEHGQRRPNQSLGAQATSKEPRSSTERHYSREQRVDHARRDPKAGPNAYDGRLLQIAPIA